MDGFVIDLTFSSVKFIELEREKDEMKRTLREDIGSTYRYIGRKRHWATK